MDCCTLEMHMLCHTMSRYDPSNMELPLHKCVGGGVSTDIGVLNVYCKLYSLDEENERERN